MDLKILHKGFNFSQDGPGNRLVYHLQGCNLHCPWCSNPESIAENGSMIVNGALLDKDCSFGAINNGVLSRNYCAECDDKPCILYPGSHISFSYTVMNIEDILDEIKRSSMMFFDGGGVTFTGGEPTMQFLALMELLKRIKKININTSLETNGLHPQLPEMFPFIDYLIIDCKHYNPAIHNIVTGLSNKITLDNIYSALKQRSQLLIRIPLIKGFNSSINDAEEFAKLFENHITANCSFELLKYHEYGKDKWEQCGMVYKQKNVNISDSEFNDFVTVFNTHNLKLIQT